MHTASQSDIAVIIVNYGTADLSIQAVQSVIDRTHAGRTVEVHLVDNASPSDDVEKFECAHKERNWSNQVHIWAETENHGFGRGNNVVLHALFAREHQPEYVFLLNPDAALETEVLDQLASALDDAPDAAVAGAGISLPSGIPVTAAFRFPSPASEFSQSINFGPISRFFANRRVPLPPDAPENSAEWVSGAAVMFRLSVVKQLKGFDPIFFLYFEEVELMHRIVSSGHDVLYLPSARVTHAEGAATKVKSGVAERKPKPKYWYQSWGYYYFKTHGRSGALIAGLAWILGASLNIPIASLRKQPRQAPLNFFKDFATYVMWPLLTLKDMKND